MAQNGTNIKEVLNEKDEMKKAEKYNAYVKEVTPTHNQWVNMGKAFLIGGIICCIGEGLSSMYQAFGWNEEMAGLYTTITLVLISVILTGLQWYARLAKFGGAGTLVPITGFANSVAAPAIDFKPEGEVFGVGCKIFVIAGPVILYGILTSWVLGVIYWIWSLM